MTHEGLIITGISKATISLHTGYNISTISFIADTPSGDAVDGYQLIARKDGNYELIIQLGTIWPAEDLYPAEHLIPIDFYFEDGEIGSILVNASDLDFGDGDYQMELNGRLQSSGGVW